MKKTFRITLVIDITTTKEGAQNLFTILSDKLHKEDATLYDYDIVEIVPEK